MYAVRGFGYCCGGASTSGGSVVVGMKSAGAIPTPTSVATAIASFNTALQPSPTPPPRPRSRPMRCNHPLQR